MKSYGSATGLATGVLSRADTTPPVAGLVFGLLGVLTFSFTLPFTRLAVRDLDPLFVGGGRAVVAAVLALALLAGRRVPRPSGRAALRLLVVAAGVIAGFPLLTSVAMQSLPANHGAVVIGALPLATAVLACLRGGERPRGLFWVASAAGLVAVFVFLATGTGGFGSFGFADLLLFAAVVLAAAGYAEGGLLAREIGAWQTICWALVIAAPVMAPVAVIGAVRGGLDSDASGWIAFGYLSLFSMFLGFFAWYRGLAIGPLTSVSQIQLVQSVFTLLWSTLFFGEHVGAWVWVAAVTVLGCALVATRSRVRSAN
ncbi:MAG: DMT family transporter [Janthinobacterium lividum]